MTSTIEWRQEREAGLRAENSWLALAGLHWLKKGENRVGAAADADIPLPAGTAPDHLGTITVAEQIEISTASPHHVEIDGQAVTHAVLQVDKSGQPTMVRCGPLSFIIIERGDQLGVRLWDNSRAERTAFPPLDWYPLDDSYRVEATYHPYETQQKLTIDNTIGTGQEMNVAGTVRFTLNGKNTEMVAFATPAGFLFLMLRDQTSGKETYAAGRYLATDPPVDGKVTIDFNRAFNPPCAITPFATCGYPPPQNHLSYPVLAGERFGNH